MKVVDLCQTSDQGLWTKFSVLVEEAYSEDTPKAKNYYGLEKVVQDHDAFFLLSDGDEALGFAGLYNNGIYPKTIARAMNRTFVTKKARRGVMAFRGGGTNRLNYMVSRYLLPPQVEYARDSRAGIFISMESSQRMRTNKALVRIMNKDNPPYEERWEALPDMYLVCPNKAGCRVDPMCWQNVCLLSYRDFKFPLDKLTKEGWKKVFDNEKA